MPWRPPRPQPHLVLRVLDDRGLPLPIHLLIPVLWLLGIRVRDMLWLVPVLGDQAWSGHCHAPPPPLPPHPQSPASTSGLVSSGSSILARSSQSSGFRASGSLIFLGGKKSQSSSRLPDSTRPLSIFTS